MAILEWFNLCLCLVCSGYLFDEVLQIRRIIGDNLGIIFHMLHKDIC